MSKMSLDDQFGHFKHKLWPKEGPRVKLPIWLLTTKSWESPWFPCVQVTCNISLESSQWGLQLFFRPHSIGGIHTKLWTPKVVRVLTLGISWLPFGSPGTKWHLGVSPWPGTKYIIRGKVVASPKSGPWWVLWIHVCPWFVRAPKGSSYALTNLLFGLCELLANLPSLIPKLQHAFLPLKCCEPGSAPQFLPLSFFLDS
jgi:hypothetical protein